MRKLRFSISVVIMACVFTTSALAEANYVYHEQTHNPVANPDRDASPACSPNPSKGRYVDNFDRSADTGFQIFARETYNLRFKVEFQFYTNEARVYYTTDGSNPSGSFGTGTGTTQVAVAAYTSTYRDCGLADQVVDILKATIPAQPAGTTVKYIIGAWHSGGGVEVFANSAGPTCTSCGFYCSTSSCATVFQYTVVQPPATAFDFDADGKADVSVWQDDTTRNWIVQKSTGGTQTQPDWGGSILNDVAVPADYDGDRKTDYAVYRPSEGNWYIIRSGDATVLVKGWGGISGDVPVPGDYDGDGKADIAIYRASEGNWYIINSATNTVTLKGWGGISGDKPVPADYDGDLKTDIAIWRPGEGNWYIINSATNTVTLKGWGSASLSDRLVPADYDGDYKADIAVWRPSEGNWYILNSATNTVTVKGWGAGSLGDIPVPADYDDDARADIAVWRPSEGNWYIIQSQTNTLRTANLGASTDTPVPSAYVR